MKNLVLLLIAALFAATQALGQTQSIGTQRLPLPMSAITCGGTDDTALFQGLAAGQYFIKGATCAISSQVTNNANNVQVICPSGEDSFHNNGAQTPAGTTFRWTGSAGGTMFQWSPVNGTATYQVAGGLIGCNLDGQSSAAIGLEVLSHRHGHFEVYTKNFTSEAVHVGVVASITNDPADAQENDFRLSIDQRATTGMALLCDGTATANCSHNRFNIDADVLNGQGVVLAAADNNWLRVRVFRANTFTGTPNDLEFRGGDSIGLAARNNIIDMITAGSSGVNANAIYARGTESGYGAASHDNLINMLDETNATPDCVRDVSATLFCSSMKESGTRRQWSSGKVQTKVSWDDSAFWIFSDLPSFGAPHAAYRKVTGDTTPANMFANGSSTITPLTNTSVWGGTMIVSCFNPASGEAASWQGQFTAKRVGGTTTFVGSPTFTLVSSDFSVTPAAPTFAVATNGVTAQVVGKAATSLDWAAYIVAAVGGAGGN